MKGRIKRLERLADQEMIVIPLKDGSLAKFPPSAAEESLATAVARLKGEDIPEHP
jgi:hypothetical protein